MSQGEAFQRPNQIAIVTGGARGIGFGVCKVLATHGITVVVTDLDDDAATEAAASLRAAGYAAEGMAHDVVRPGDSQAVVDRVLEDHGRIDILVNSAGIAGRKSLVEMSDHEWQQMINVNLTSVFYVTRAVMPHMLKRSYGRVVTIASVLGKVGKPQMTHYAASKFGVIGFTQALALEVADHGITVNAVCPGIVRTRLWEQELAEVSARDGITVDEAWAEAVKGVPLGRAQEPTDIGETIAFLASDVGANITGQAINVDGGFVMH